MTSVAQPAKDEEGERGGNTQPIRTLLGRNVG